MKLVPALVIGLKLNWALAKLNRIESHTEDDIEQRHTEDNNNEQQDDATIDNTKIVPILRGSTSDLGVLSTMKKDNQLKGNESFKKGRHLKSYSGSGVAKGRMSSGDVDPTPAAEAQTTTTGTITIAAAADGRRRLQQTQAEYDACAAAIESIVCPPAIVEAVCANPGVVCTNITDTDFTFDVFLQISCKKDCKGGEITKFGTDAQAEVQQTLTDALVADVNGTSALEQALQDSFTLNGLGDAPELDSVTTVQGEVVIITPSPTSQPSTTPVPNGCPAADIVECNNGWTVSVGGNTMKSDGVTPWSGFNCYGGCGGTTGSANTALCCGGLNSCNQFTGYVCKDGVSCSDGSGASGPNGYACYGANIGMVYNGCSGKRSCSSSILAEVQYACNGTKSCQQANNFGEGSGVANVYLDNCCNGVEECRRFNATQLSNTCSASAGAASVTASTEESSSTQRLRHRQHADNSFFD